VKRKFICILFFLIILTGFPYDIFSQETSQKKVSSSNQRKAEIYFKQANSKYTKNDLRGAIRDYTMAIKLNPQYIEAYSNRGLIKDILLDYEGSIADYNKALELTSKKYDLEEIMDLIDIYMSIGNIKTYNSDYDGAVEEYSKVINLHPTYSPAYIARAEVKLILEDYDGALIDYDKAIQINPNVSAEIYYKRGNIKYILKKYEDSINDYTESINRFPNYQDAYYQLIGSCIMSSKFNSALDYIEQYNAIVKNPYIYARDFQEWNKNLNKYKQDNIISDIKIYLKRFKVTLSD